MSADVIATLELLDRRLSSLRAALGDATPTPTGVPDLHDVPIGQPPPIVPPPGDQGVGAGAGPGEPAGLDESASPDAFGVLRAPAAVAETVSLDCLIAWSRRMSDSLATLTALQAEIEALVDGATRPAAPVPVATPRDSVFEGRVTLDAGPFAGVASIAGFTGVLRRIRGSLEVSVVSMAVDRAVIEVDLGEAVALDRELQAVLPVGFSICDTGPDSVRIDLAAGTTPGGGGAPGGSRRPRPGQ